MKIKVEHGVKPTFATSIPKAGTHLFGKVIELISGQYPLSVKKNTLDYGLSKKQLSLLESCNLLGHFRSIHLDEDIYLKNLFLSRTVFILIRDPRDICNSMLHYLETSTNLNHQSIANLLVGLNYTEKIKLLSSGLKSPNSEFEVYNLNDHCSGFLEIKNHIPDAVIIKYEDFFDGDKISNTLSHALGVPYELVDVSVKKALASDTKTKRVGIPYMWKHSYDEQLIDYLNNNFSQVISAFGYDL
ncbi:MAG: hypothetical protein NTY50_05560 [Methylobacter sp.]|nr:hypothetical protein [Methylobacter sp.]